MARNSSKNVQTKITEQKRYDVIFDTVNGDIYEVACQMRVLHLALESGNADTILNKEMLPHLVLHAACRLEKAIERLNNLS